MIGNPKQIHAIWGDQIENILTDGTCGNFGVEGRCVQSFGGEIRRRGIIWKTYAYEGWQ